MRAVVSMAAAGLLLVTGPYVAQAGVPSAEAIQSAGAVSASAVPAVPAATACPPDLQSLPSTASLGATFDGIALSSSQVATASTIVDVARSMNISRRGVRIAIAVAMQESSLDPAAVRNSYVGLFQQRADTSTGLYTAGNRLDGAGATRMFFEQLVKRVPGYATDARLDWQIGEVVQQSDVGQDVAQWFGVSEAMTARLFPGPMVTLISSASMSSASISSSISAAARTAVAAPNPVVAADATSGQSSVRGFGAAFVVDGSRSSSALGAGGTSTGSTLAGSTLAGSILAGPILAGSRLTGSTGSPAPTTTASGTGVSTTSTPTGAVPSASTSTSGAPSSSSRPPSTGPPGTVPTPLTAPTTTSSPTTSVLPTTSAPPTTTALATTTLSPTVSPTTSALPTSALPTSALPTSALPTTRPPTTRPPVTAPTVTAPPTTSRSISPPMTGRSTTAPTTTNPPGTTTGRQVNPSTPASPVPPLTVNPDPPEPPVPTGSSDPSVGPDPAPATAPGTTSHPDTVVPAIDCSPSTGGGSTAFNPGMIISDAVFYDTASMTAAEIRAFINAKGAGCTADACLRSLRVSTPSEPADRYCATYQGGTNEDVATVLQRLSVACGINPQVMLTTLQKESALLTRTDVSMASYNAAYGWHCPDTGPGGTANCDPQYAGFFNQAYGMAKQWSRYRMDPAKYNYRAGQTTTILWNVAQTGCGGSSVYIRNTATASLYDYTPYQPNAASLAGYPGVGDRCSAYGNRNFFFLFQKYFGTTGGGTDANIVLNGVRVTIPSGPHVAAGAAGKVVIAPNAAVARGLAAGFAAIGLPYVYGGGTDGGAADQGCSRAGGALNSCQGIVGFDCSGLTAYVLGQAGYAIPTYSGDQRAAGVPVAWTAGRPGDIIGYQGHVAVYLGVIDGVPYLMEAPDVGMYVQVRPVYYSNGGVPVDTVLHRFWK